MIMFNLTDIELVIFDCDGVLVDSEPLSNAVLAKHATHLGWSLSEEDSQAIFKGMTMEQVHRRIELELGKTFNSSWIKDYYRDSYALFETDLKPIRGVEKLIKRVIKAQKKLCVASQGPHEKMELTLGVTGLAKYFEGHIYSAHDVARPKPFPDLFLHAAKAMQVVPEKCCVIEDSQTGVKAALDAQMDVIYFQSHLTALPSQNETNVNHVYQMDDIFA